MTRLYFSRERDDPAAALVVALDQGGIIMKRKIIVSVVIIVIAVIVSAVYLAFVVPVKNKEVLLNELFVNEKNYTIGVDISDYQADVDMKRLKEQDIEFVYIKATEGSSHQDKSFEKNWKNAEDAGLLSGAYHFFSFDSTGRKQAYNFIRTVGHDMTGRMLPAVDVEYYGDKENNPPEKEDVVKELGLFLDSLEEEYGVKPVIYTSPGLYRTYLKDDFRDYQLWMSSLYTPLDWRYHGDWIIWQYLDRGVLDGYSGGEKYIDLNVLNKKKSLDELIVR